MCKALIYIVLLLSGCALWAQPRDSVSVSDGPKGKVIPVEGAFIHPLQKRDSVLIADQLLYGFELKGLAEGTMIGLPVLPEERNDTLMILSQWSLDTLKVSKARKGTPGLLDIRGSIKIAPFEEGIYELPQIAVQRLAPDGIVDTLLFDPVRLEVKTMPVDTADFVPHDIKGQIRYPVTFREVIPWAGLSILAVLSVCLVVWLIIRYRRKNDPAYIYRDPAHIVALRKLDKFRGNRMWAPEQQKAFYSGVTDVLREYMAGRYEIGAMEMTTAEIFDEMKSTDVPKELLDEVRELFERADFVKFAKYVVSDDDNAKALPLAVRFVTETYQAEIENEEKGGAE